MITSLIPGLMGIMERAAKQQGEEHKHTTNIDTHSKSHLFDGVKHSVFHVTKIMHK